MSDDAKETGKTRRDFLKVGGTALAVGALRVPAVHAAGSDEIKIGLIGCGGRGRGAVSDALKGAPGVRLVAMGDAFADRIEEGRKGLAEVCEKVAVPEYRSFVWPDFFSKVNST